VKKLMKQDLTPVILETHATSWDNEAGLASGWHDVDLSPAGERQAAELGMRHAGTDIALILCSDLRRSWRTAEIAFGDRLTIVRDPRLRECDYGDLTRAPTPSVDARRLACISAPFPNGESYEQAIARVASALADLRRPAARSPVLVIGHRATFYALEHVLRGRPLEEVIAAPWRWQPGWVY
jgi:broad specificity phosphatase PhoE